MRFGPFYSIVLKCWQYVFYVSCKFPMAWSYHHSTFLFLFFWKLRIRYKISILGYSAKFFQQKCTREYFIFCYFNAFSLWGYSLPLFYLFFCIFRWIYTSQGLLLVEKWVLLLTDVGTTLKWDCMFSLVAIIIFSVWWKRWT